MTAGEEYSKSSIGYIDLDLEKEAENRHNPDTQQPDTANPKTKLIIGIIFNLIIISVFLIIRFAHPSKPEFIIQDATVFTFNLSTAAPPATLLSSTLQITISSKNPNDISGIYYEDLGIYAQYKNQQITCETNIPRLYQAHMETNVWSLFVNATNVLIAPYNVPYLVQDQSNGIIDLTIKLDGHIRWKVIGSLITRKYHIHVLCNAMMDFGQGKFGTNDFNGGFVFASVKYRLYWRCSVTV